MYMQALWVSHARTGNTHEDLECRPLESKPQVSGVLKSTSYAYRLTDTQVYNYSLENSSSYTTHTHTHTHIQSYAVKMISTISSVSCKPTDDNIDIS